MSDDPLAVVRLFADIRRAALQLVGLDHPSADFRARLIRKPEIHKALADLLWAASQLSAGPDEAGLFWHPDREPRTEAERRFDTLRTQIIGGKNG